MDEAWPESHRRRELYHTHRTCVLASPSPSSRSSPFLCGEYSKCSKFHECMSSCTVSRVHISAYCQMTRYMLHNNRESRNTRLRTAIELQPGGGVHGIPISLNAVCKCSVLGGRSEHTRCARVLTWTMWPTYCVMTSCMCTHACADSRHAIFEPR